MSDDLYLIMLGWWLGWAAGAYVKADARIPNWRVYGWPLGGGLGAIMGLAVNHIEIGWV